METPREILFRAKRTDNGEWIEGSYVHQIDNYGDKVDWHYIIEGTATLDYDIDEPIKIDPATLSQFIGWKDSHGNRMFENDIVEIVSSPKRSYKYLIWWNREMSITTAVPLDDIHFNGTDYWGGNPSFNYAAFCLMLQDPWGDFSDVKVIGNLFDNADIIKEALNE
jgi:uncharacterized phage protein (TIGR01671 family)